MPYRASQIPDFTSLSRRVAGVARDKLVELMDRYAELEREEFVDRIERQRFASFRVVLYPESGTNLSLQWIERKIAKGADTRTMIATGHYLWNIRVFRKVQRGNRGGLWRIGFHPRVFARDLNGDRVPILLQDVAAIHEVGNTNTPARQHWGPNLNRMRREAPRVRRAMKAEILEAVRHTVGRRMVVGGRP